MRREVARAIDRDRVLEPGEAVLVACSGGPDSTVLLDALARLAAPRGLRLTAAHVDHGLRPGSADEAAVVEAFAISLAVPFVALTVAVAAPPGSLQDRARTARHAGLAAAARAGGASAIALGHTADDQAETVLMRALTGASPRSLAAMSPRAGCLARPLLRVWRQEVIDYCTALDLRPLEDPSNHDRRHLRTRVRHELLPALERVFPAARRRLVVLADRERAAASDPDGSQHGGTRGVGKTSDGRLPRI